MWTCFAPLARLLPLSCLSLTLCSCHYTESNGDVAGGGSRSTTSIFPLSSKHDSKEEQSQMAGNEPESAAFHLDDLEAERANKSRRYLPFFRSESMNTGIYVLPKGATDLQSPHEEDEIYQVLKGRAQFTVGEKNHAVRAGSILYVKRGIEHRFHAIEEDLHVLVVFAAQASEHANQ